MYNPFSLGNKTILITGASSGIGRSIAIECSKMGANLVITARNKERLDETYDSLYGNNHKKILADLSNENELFDIVAQLPKLDGIVHSAGIVKAIIAQISEKKDTIDIFNINTFVPIYLTQFLLQNKKINKKASIVFISSISGVYCGAIGGSLYGASKAALQGFTKALALELAPREIRANTINPGMIDTEIFINTAITSDQLKADMQSYPLKRYGKPEEVAYAAIYLLSDATQWMTGTSLLLDGGFTIK